MKQLKGRCNGIGYKQRKVWIFGMILGKCDNGLKSAGVLLSKICGFTPNGLQEPEPSNTRFSRLTLHLEKSHGMTTIKRCLGCTCNCQDYWYRVFILPFSELSQLGT
jgi:hypothetical protein